MQILSVNVALPREVAWKGKVVRTSIFKQPVAGDVRVYAEHLEGDGQADLRVHGGRDKAVYAYPQEHYRYWQDYLAPEKLVAGCFGENLTTRGLLENHVRVGDQFQVGTAVLLAVQPRRPCVKLDIRLQQEGMVQQFEQAQRSGIYFRVEREGIMQAGSPLTLVQRSAYDITIQDMVESNQPGFSNTEKLRQLVALPYLSPTWRERLARQLTATGGH